MLSPSNEGCTPLQVFRDYVGLKLHFAGDLVWSPDIKLRLNEDTLKARRDSNVFHRAAGKFQRRDLQELLISCLYRDPEFWIGELDHQENTVFHKKRMVRYGSLLYTFRTDIEGIAEYMQESCVPLQELLNPRAVPRIIKDRRKIPGGVTDETLGVLDYYFNFCGRANTPDPLWNRQAALLSRYKYFCKPDAVDKAAFEVQLNKLIK